VPGPRNWSLYLFLLTTVLQGIGVLAAVVNISGAVLASWTGDAGAAVLPGLGRAEAFSVVVVAAVVVLLLAGGFNWLDNANKAMMGILSLATILAFVPVFPPPADLSRLVIPSLPDGSIVLVAAMLGWMPTGIDVAVWHSFWTIEKLERLGMGEAGDTAARRGRMRIALVDMRLGFAISLTTAVMFLCLGAAHLREVGAELSGPQFAEAISTAYTAIFGRWMYHVFMLSAFFAMFSTSYVVIDGFSRSFSEALAVISPRLGEPLIRRRTLLGFMLFSALFAVATIILVGNPVSLVVAASLVSLGAAPVIYGLSMYCVSKHIEDLAMRARPAVMVLALLGVVFVTAALLVWIHCEFVMK